MRYSAAHKYRFPIVLDIRYQVVKGKQVLASGAGKTITISSQEICFTTEQPLSPGEGVRLAADWPVMLDNTCAMTLEICGCVVGSEPGTASAEIARYGFRTRGQREASPDSMERPRGGRAADPAWRLSFLLRRRPTFKANPIASYSGAASG